MATIAPPIAGVTVYFRVFDVDDPFDQIHGPDAVNNPGANPASVIANVNLIDNGQIGGDNRGTTTGLGDSSAVTDANGVARITITVSMQPGDNYRAAASVISEAVQTQIGQTDADALSATQVTNTDGTQYWKANGGFTGYQVPTVWSPMLTVWRKLHVEVDSMGFVTRNSATGTIVSVTTDPTAAQVQFEITDLPDDFEEEGHFHLGQVSIAGFGLFRTVDSSSGFLFDDYLTIANPDGVDFSESIGASYTLVDDDIGGVLGFPTPPVVFPLLPDTGLMDTVYARAYLLVERLTNPDVSQTNLAFSRNLLSQGDAYAMIDGSKDVNSSLAYWAVHVVSVYQGYSSRDGDPDGEEGASGFLYGLTKAGVFSSRGGSVVFLETCRDKNRSEPAIGDLIRFNVAHEVGHQFNLEHADGAENPPGSGTYLMQTSASSVMPDNSWFSATSLNKIRSLHFPQDE